MESVGVSSEKAHAVLVPFPAQGHITPMLKLAKLLHSHGFHITLVNTEFNHRRLLLTQGDVALAGLPDFRFETIPDGLPPPSDTNATQDLRSLCTSILNNFLPSFTELLHKLNRHPSFGGAAPPVTQIVYDSMMSFCLDAGSQLRIPVTAFWTASACGLMGYLHFQDLVDRGITPFKDESYLTNGCLEEAVDWIPGMAKLRLKDLPSFFRTTDADDIFFNFIKNSAQRLAGAKAVIINTFDDLERPVLDALAALLPPLIYTVGPINLLSRRFPENSRLKSIGANLWKEDDGCVEWLDGRDRPRSVVFINFGSVTVMTNEQLLEFAWGLAGSGYDFLWVIRGDLVVKGEFAVLLPAEFLEETKGRGCIVRWCAQEEILAHPAVGLFLTHAGWNSVMESLSGGGGGVPMVCWPFFAEQQTNCRYACAEWGVGMEIEKDVKREEVAGLIREAMEGGLRGREMKRRAMEWKESAVRATQEEVGSSFMNLHKVVKTVLLM